MTAPTTAGPPQPGHPTPGHPTASITSADGKILYQRKGSGIGRIVSPIITAIA